MTTTIASAPAVTDFPPSSTAIDMMPAAMDTTSTQILGTYWQSPILAHHAGALFLVPVDFQSEALRAAFTRSLGFKILILNE